MCPTWVWRGVYDGHESVYWPAMSSEVKYVILKCDICRSVEDN